jgi:hypothetical protein
LPETGAAEHGRFDRAAPKKGPLVVDALHRRRNPATRRWAEAAVAADNEAGRQGLQSARSGSVTGRFDLNAQGCNPREGLNRAPFGETAR